MICCPFHNDHHPSMKLNTTYYYCFGCGATGDVIQFVANLFGLSNYEAAKKIAVDFGITPDNPPIIAALKKPEYMETKNRQKELRECQEMPENGMRISSSSEKMESTVCTGTTRFTYG